MTNNIDMTNWHKNRAYLARSRELWSKATSLTPRAFDAAMGCAERAAHCDDWQAVAGFLDDAKKVLNIRMG